MLRNADFLDSVSRTLKLKWYDSPGDDEKHILVRDALESLLVHTYNLYSLEPDRLMACIAPLPRVLHITINSASREHVQRHHSCMHDS